jgi:serine protease Do
MNEMKFTMKRTHQSLSKFVPLILLGGMLGARTAVWAGGKGEKTKPSVELNLKVDDTPVARDGRIATSFSPVVKKVAPSVVKVFTKQKGKVVTQGGFGPGMGNPMFREFFGDESPFGPGGGRQFRTPTQKGIGSGVILTKDGYIITNNHVVEGADEVDVTLNDGRELKAKVIGKDPKSDVAVIKVEGKDLPAISLADSDKIEVGDVVLAVGNPFGIGQTVTMGMVSATGRDARGLVDLDYQDFIQTDAAINPGNSGGALVDAQGRLVGINTAILSRSGGNQGIGFAIPTNLAREVMDELVTHGQVTRGYLGVLIQDITPGLAKEFKLEDRKGALVGEVTPKSPAAKAGVESGDIVVALNDKDVTDSRHLKLEIARIKPGESATLKVLREGETKTLKVKVGELPGQQELAKNDAGKDDEGTLNGVTVSDLEPRMRQQFGVPPKVKGALVTQVEPDSAAAEAGLQAGDVILEINHEPVTGASEAVKLTEEPADKTTLLKLWTRGATRFVVVDESSRG